MSFLDDIITRKVIEVEQSRKRIPMEDLIRACASLPPVVSLKDALANGAAPRIIAEIKRASPSRGPIRPDIDAATIAREYMDHGAAAISVLTDGPGFGGSLDDLRDAHRVVVAARNAAIPILRKDFLIDPYQVWEARETGADAVLLIVAALGSKKLKLMLDEASRAGMVALVEVHKEDEMRIAADAGAQIIGINNRDLKTFKVDTQMAVKLAPLAPKDAIMVVESGIKSPEDIQRYLEHGFRAFLIGEALMMAPDIGARLKEFVSCAR